MNSLPLPPAYSRLDYLDFSRGLAVIGMVLVNRPGNYDSIYSQLKHSDWNGLTFADVVFPLFIFISGISVALALTTLLSKGARNEIHWKKLCKRVAMLILIGIALSIRPNMEIADVRLLGVLQRIAIVYFAIVCFLYWFTPTKQSLIALGILVFYWAFNAFVPIPIDDTIGIALATSEVLSSQGTIVIEGLTRFSDGWVDANQQPGTSWQSWIDRQFLPFSLYEVTWDPEGIFSTLPALAGCMLGALVGQYWFGNGFIVSGQGAGNKTIRLFLLALLFIAVGLLLDAQSPMNKNLWSTSFVLVTSGISIMIFTAAYWFLTMAKVRLIMQPVCYFGKHALILYVLHELVVHVMLIDVVIGSQSFSFHSVFMGALSGLGLGAKLVSALWSLLYCIAIYFILKVGLYFQAMLVHRFLKYSEQKT